MPLDVLHVKAKAKASSTLAGNGMKPLLGIAGPNAKTPNHRLIILII